LVIRWSGGTLALLGAIAAWGMLQICNSLVERFDIAEALGPEKTWVIVAVMATGVALFVVWRPPADKKDLPKVIEPFIIRGLGAAGIALLVIQLWGIAGRDAEGWRGDLVERTRTFHGILMVTEDRGIFGDGLRRELYHGSILHGLQFMENDLHRRPTSYYTADSGVGVILEEWDGPRSEMKVGIIGLGTGATTVFAEPGETWRIYEIDPEIERFARTHFRWLADCQATNLEVIIGDGRLSLEREEPNQFDVLAVDAFTGDAIPIHLLTREAVELYFRHLKPEGVLAVHIQNRHIDLLPVVGRIAADMELWMADKETVHSSIVGAYSSRWVLLARSGRQLGRATVRVGMDWVSDPLAVKMRFGDAIQWTDDYSSILPILKFLRKTDDSDD